MFGVMWHFDRILGENVTPMTTKKTHQKYTYIIIQYKLPQHIRTEKSCIEIYPCTQYNINSKNSSTNWNHNLQAYQSGKSWTTKSKAIRICVYSLPFFFGNSYLIFTNIHLNMFQENANHRYLTQLFQCRQNNLGIYTGWRVDYASYKYGRQDLDMDAAALYSPITQHPNRVLKTTDRWRCNYYWQLSHDDPLQFIWFWRKPYVIKLEYVSGFLIHYNDSSTDFTTDESEFDSVKGQ